MLRAASPAPQAHGGDHQPGISEDHVGLFEALPGDAADEIFDRYEDIAEGKRRGVGCPDAVLLLAFALIESLCALLDDEKGRAFGGFGQQGNEIGITAGGDELLVAVDPVAGDFSGVIGYRIGRGLQGGQIAAGIRLGHRIGHQGIAVGDGAQPFLFLLFGTPFQQRIGAQLDRKETGSNTQAYFGHLAGDGAAVSRTAADAAIFLRNENQLQTDFGTQHLADLFFRENIQFVELLNFLLGEHFLFQIPDRIQDHFLCAGIQTSQAVACVLCR